MILFVDVETTGLIRHDLPMEDERQPRLVELAAILTSEQDLHTPVFTLNAIIKPVGFAIPPDIVHGISHDYASAFGENLSDVLDTLLRMCKATSVDPASSRIIGYNVEFDTFVLSREMHFIYPPSVAEFATLRPFCVMKALAHVWQSKWLSLDDAYERLFSRKPRPEGKHRAMLDTMATIDMYEEGRRREWWR